MEDFSLSGKELGVVGLVVIAAGVLVWRIVVKFLEAFVGDESPVRELTTAVRELTAKTGELHARTAEVHAELVAARHDRGDPTPITVPGVGGGAYHLRRPKGSGNGGGVP